MVYTWDLGIKELISQRCNLNISHCDWKCWTLDPTHHSPTRIFLTVLETTTHQQQQQRRRRQRKRTQQIPQILSPSSREKFACNVSKVCMVDWYSKTRTRYAGTCEIPITVHIWSQKGMRCHSQFASKTTPLRAQNTTGLLDLQKNQSNSRITCPI